MIIGKPLQPGNMTLDDALATLSGQRGFTPQPTYPQAVNERLLVVAENAKASMARATEPVPGAVPRLLNTALMARTASARVTWLQRAADHVVESYGPHSACREGCTHCCHIPVSIGAAEASVIGKAIGRKPLPLKDHQPVEVTGYESPCPMLKGGRCSIYAHRPAVCRTHMNMDVDDLLCQLVDDSIPVPYLDARQFQLASLMIQPDPASWADIRQWFPPDRP